MSARHRLAAWAALWRHYGAVLAHCWKARRTMASGLLTEDEAAFMPAALSLQEKPLSATARWTGRTLMTLVGMALIWSILGKVDIIVTATGKIVPSNRTKTITSVDVAVVRALHVREGQSVNAGDVLMELDASATDAERDKAQGDAAMAALEVARSQAMITAVERLRAPRMPPVDSVSTEQWQAAQHQLEGQWLDFYAKLAKIDGNIAQYAQDLPLATRRANDYRILAHDRDVSEHAWIEKEQARIELARQLADAVHQRQALIAQTRKEAHDALISGRKAGAASRQDERRAHEHSKLLKLVTPVDGTVQQLTVHTVGAAVPAAQALMMIVPQEKTVEVEAFLENKDVGFVQEGQEVQVKIDAFNYTKYGTVPARVTHVSRDAIQDERKGLIYAVKISMDRSNINVEGREMRLSAGMAINAEIKTGTRRVIEYVLSPLVQHQHEALHER
ncbi:HlyD family type I secretion periplasmic adaptor subunit [Herbaspirillum seropedicae]|uniref:HlyD family type I secretion periplasmic adaptor subunit n=1 Tax=Herbaspirillum seropedicae TaxID=964 RepID=UPI0011239C73|nr:HlyD family type I secretion periplasmic adaptor subunit [Herbaspirillum seropedicae]QDD63646.1 HlyD family type I secretion periplasmic adaptor subunit [Herbaspirillum seropedicae]